ncbi:hypothetical protein ASPACDRAFT_1852205 [Aspergillus aculeatus ATCC 16872]|uniref:Ribonuclease H2 subunit B n=1 Tax=Aspergillus aculeatus (strain ATCC 16872 / CBS 172.66 / WB 5094) TaxID=690307 RepID=A0A1L9XA09_ASPA1|nr:uncharacterized protein ASPACDRAFT_1852205 [Aspergillus aculeatus ATCC 16872]OJK05260.1 hypothetical protein ASPACDRAFT_1852205 [Aspergillus aculeatus ATCC 16872]
MPRTRSSAPSEPTPQSASASPPSSELEQQQQPPKQPLNPTKPSKTFILPSTASPEARFLTLPNPQTSEPTRYFFCPQQGVYEFITITTAAPAARSILFARNNSTPTTTTSDDDTIEISPPTAQEPARRSPPALISSTASIHLATPLDFIFFLIPLLTTAKATLYQPLDDIIDSIQDELAPHLRHVLYNESFRATIHARAAAICDAVDAGGDEKLFRFSEKKLLMELMTKAERILAAHGGSLPPSLEERFVRSELAMPLMGVKRSSSSSSSSSNTSAAVTVEVVVSGNSEENKENELAPQKKEEAPVVADADSTTTAVKTEEEELLPEGPSTPEGVAELLRISTALTFIKESYLSREMGARIEEMLAAPDAPRDFRPMREHLELVARLRKEALAARSLGDFSRKRSAEDEEAAESRAEKKRRQEEEEKKKKAGESRGVRDLKKVNTTGMKKMSDFFGKAAAKKKA